MDIRQTLTPEKLKDLYLEQKYTVKQIASLYNLKVYQIEELLREYSISKNKKPKISKDILIDLYLVKGMSARQIAEKYKIGKSTVQRLLNKYGIIKSKEQQLADRQITSETTLMKKYQVKNVSQILSVQEKREKTFLKKYNAKNPMQNPIIKNKQKTTLWERHRVKNPMEIPEVIEKQKNTFLKRYEVKTPLLSPEIQEKIMQTNLKSYGVPYYCMTDNCKKHKGTIISKPNILWYNKLRDMNYLVELEYTLLDKSFDLYIKDTNILLEINPTRTHNSTKNYFSKNSPPLDKNYHYQKSKVATENGFHCIHIWDWDDEEKVLSMLNKKERIQGRKTKIKIISTKEANDFNSMYHLQNSCQNQKVCLGLYYKDTLVSMMSFGKPRYNKNFQWELLRYTVHSKYMVIGGAERLFKHFIKEFKPETILTYCDYSKFSGQVYKKLGFEYLRHNTPTCHWVKGDKRITQAQLNKYGFDKLLGECYGYYGKGTNNQELMLKHGFVQVYDCGQLVFSWKAKDFSRVPVSLKPATNET